jgi:nitrate/nitrite transport system substrate-binding protein
MRVWSGSWSLEVTETVRRKVEVRVGFVPLLDAAPLIAAYELGYFTDEGLTVVLERQIGWGNVRDKLTFGNLHASHALLGMPAASVLKWPRYPEKLVSLLSLGFGGNAITISRRLFESGVESATSLADWIRQSPRGRSPLLLAHVFGCSTHHYLLRDWLSKGGIDPDRDVRLCVLPPPQMVRQMNNGYIDCFCVGDPWNTDAELMGCGQVVALTADVIPMHPEKVLAVSRRWLEGHAEAAKGLVRAVVRAGEFCGNPQNRGRLTEILAQPQYLSIEPETLARSFNLSTRSASPDGCFYVVSAASMFPSATHVAWLLSEMARWNHLAAEVDLASVASRSIEGSVYREIAQSMGIECPIDDFPPMKLRNGWFTLNQSAEEQGSLLPTT